MTEAGSPGTLALAEEHKRLKIALDVTQLGTWSHDLRTQRVVLDARARQHYGLHSDQLTIEDVVRVVHPEDRARLGAEMNAVLDTHGKDRFETEYRVVDPSGERWLRVQVVVEFEGEGAERRPILGYGTTQDITAARTAAREQHEQSLLLKDVSEIAQIGGWDFDVETGLGHWTEETCAIHGLAAPPERAYSGLDRFEGQAREAVERALAEAIAQGTPYDLDLPFTCTKGLRKWVRASCRPVVEQGRVVRLRGTLQDISVRKNAEQALARFVAASPAVIYALTVTPDALTLAWIGGDLERLTGWRAHDADAGSWWSDNLHPEDRERVLASSPVPYTIDHLTIEFRFRRPDGSHLWLRDERRLLRDEHGRPSEVVGSWSDVTERVELEAKLRQSHKLEALGQLAGGIAHDFNNLLTVIRGNGEVLASELPAVSNERPLLEEIITAGDRASALTRQLLAFSRKQVLQPAVIDANAAIERLTGILRRLIGEDIDVRCQLAPDAGHVLIDPGQFEQIVLNLAVNARDAMPRGGRLTIATASVRREEAGPDVALPAATRLVRLTMADTGEGMSAEVLAHIFEPFFTTKPAGRGTGLGLATVFGIVKQSGGHIAVQSEKGRGTTLTIHLPRAEASLPAGASVAPHKTGAETVMVVDDDEGVRRIAALTLRRQGYKVIETGDAQTALERASAEHVDLLLTDVVMPGMSGPDLADAMSRARPGLKVLFMSGYVHDTLQRQGLSDGKHAFLFKPFNVTALADRVRQVLDAI